MSDRNIYYRPEAFGATTVAHAWVEDLSYEYDEFAVWRVGDRFYWASDSGCSCPIPFEEVTLETAASGTAKDALIDLEAWVASRSTDHWSGPSPVNCESARNALTDLVKQGL